jgi:hypothetical protein
MKIPIEMLTLMLGLNVRKFILVLFALLLFVSASLALAEERSFTKGDTPSPVLVLSNEGVGLANFYANSLDFPSGTLPDPKELLEIAWRTTYYPESANSKVELCYFRPYSSQPRISLLTHLALSMSLMPRVSITDHVLSSSIMS